MKYNYFTASALVLFAYSASAVWSTEEEGFYYAKENTGKYPAICLIECSDKESRGTGFLVAPNVIATITHVVSSTKSDNQGSAEITYVSPQSLNVSFFANGVSAKYEVQETSHFDNRGRHYSRLENKQTVPTNYDSISLLFLKTNVNDIAPLKLQAITPDSSIKEVTFTGFGRGGLLNPHKFPDMDLNFEDPIFRAKTGVKNPNGFKFKPDESKIKTRNLEIEQRNTKTDKGDSGGPVINPEGFVIGINQSGSSTASDILSPEAVYKKAEEAQKIQREQTEQLTEKFTKLLENTKKINELTTEKQKLQEDLNNLNKPVSFFNKLGSLFSNSNNNNNEQKIHNLIKMIEINQEIESLCNDNLNLNKEINSLEKQTENNTKFDKRYGKIKTIEEALENLNNNPKATFGNYALTITPEVVDWVNKTIEDWNKN